MLASKKNTSEDSSASINTSDTTLELDAAKFDETIDGKKTALYTLKNTSGLELKITNYGGRFVSLIVPDKRGKLTDVVIGMNSATAFKNATEPYLGATISRYGN